MADRTPCTPGGLDEIATDVATRLRLVIARLARQLRREASGGLTPAQFSALTTIEYAKALRLGQLAEAEGVSPPTVTRLAAALEQAGLVVCRVDPTDARSTMIAVTDAGRASINAVRAERTKFLERR